jgi:hypothetical protein
MKFQFLFQNVNMNIISKSSLAFREQFWIKFTRQDFHKYMICIYLILTNS